MECGQPSFTDVEYGNRRRVSRREQFLDTMDATIPWATWVGLIEPHYYSAGPGRKGRKAKPIETMLRMYLLQVWFCLSDEGVEEAVYDSYAMRRFMGLDFAVEQVPDATTLLHFRHLLERHTLGEKLFAAQSEIFESQGWIMRGGSIVDATIIAAPSSTKNATGTRDPQMHQTKKGNQWYFGMKAQHRCRRRHRVCPLGHRDGSQRARLGRGGQPGTRR
jgi:IS5 family transposase